MVDVVGLHDARLGILKRPHHASQDARHHLQARGAIERRESPGFMDRQARSIPISTFCMSHQQHTQLILAIHYLVPKNPLVRLQVPVPARKFVHREHRIVARVIGIMYRWTVNHLPVLSQCKMIGYRNGFTMGDQKTMVRTAERYPAPHASGGTGPVEINGGVTTKSMTCRIRWPMTLMGAPPRLRRLKTFAHESIH